MARYSSMLGRCVVVHYRERELLLTATGLLTADSGKSIFLQVGVTQQHNVKTFRWEVSYSSIVQIEESPAAEPEFAASRS